MRQSLRWSGCLSERWYNFFSKRFAFSSPPSRALFAARARLSISRCTYFNTLRLSCLTGETLLRKQWQNHSLPLVLKHYLCSTHKDGATIFALSSAPGRAAIAIIRLSGSACLQVYKAICPDAPPLKPRFASLRTLFEPRPSSSSSEVLDSGALLLYFPGPQTVTGEDVLEFHVHGGPAIVKAVLAAIPNAITLTKDSPIVRYAEPGEFTRRAFYNDRLDLTQIEALGETLSAETEQQRRLAVRGTNNSLTERYETWRRQLLDARGELEALIDFSEDQHFDESPKKLVASVKNQVARLKNHIQASILNASRGELLRDGINIALLGSPNAGKSSLLNRIAGREAAIVSKEAGTTRDVVDINVDIGGFFCRFGDLAGIRESLIDHSQLPDQQVVNPIGEIEEEGIRRAKARVAAADIIILVLSIEPDLNQGISAVISPDILKTLAGYDVNRQQLITVINKSDLIPVNQEAISSSNIQAYLQTNHLSNVLKPFTLGPLHLISCKEDSGGFPDFLSHLIQLFHKITSPVDVDGESGNPTSTIGSSNQPLSESLGASERQRLLLVDCNNHLLTFLDSISTRRLDMESPGNEDSEGIDIVLAAESLRAAGECLAKITGKGEAGDVEEVLGVVFEKFCVGK